MLKALALPDTLRALLMLRELKLLWRLIVEVMTTGGGSGGGGGLAGDAQRWRVSEECLSWRRPGIFISLGGGR